MARFAAFGAICKIGNQNRIQLAAATWAAGVATFTTVSAHGYANADTVTIRDVVPSGYNGTRAIAGVTATTFTQAIAADPGGAGTVFGTAQKADVFATVAQVRSISGPSLSADTVDVTTHDSPGAWREFLPTLLDAGEITLELVFDPDDVTHIALRNDFTNRVAHRNFQIIFPDATSTTWTCPAIVTGFSPDAPVDGALTAAITLKLSDDPVLA